MSNNFANFTRSFAADADAIGPMVHLSSETTVKPFGQRIAAYTDFISTVAHSSYNGGLLRFLLPNTLPSLTEWNSDAGIFSGWPQARPFFHVFAFDWQGNQFGFDRRFLRPDGEPMVSILEMGTGRVLKMPVTFSELLDREVIVNSDAALCSSVFKKWTERHPKRLLFHRCIGYRQPLFLNGTDGFGNMEEVDLDVYVTTAGQLFRGATRKAE